MLLPQFQLLVTLAAQLISYEPYQINDMLKEVGADYFSCSLEHVTKINSMKVIEISGD